MRACDNCGAEVVPGDAFCGTCGAFLAWDGEDAAGTTRAADAPKAAPVADAPKANPAPAAGPPEAAPAHNADVRPSQAKPARTADVGPPATTPAHTADAGPRQTTPAPAVEAEAETRPAVAPPADATVGAASPGDGDPAGVADRERRAAALVVPVRPAEDVAGAAHPADPGLLAPTSGGAPPAPAVDQPGAVRPGRPVEPVPVVRDFAGDPVGAGEVACPACGTGNPRGRAFCRRCGGSLLAAAGPAAAVPWWRRLRWPRRRPGRGLLRRLLAVLVVLLLLAGAAWAVVRFGGPVVDAIRDRTAKPEAVLPTSVTASSEARGHPARSTVDGLNNRYWSPATDRPATGQYVELTFDPPIRLMDLIVHAGASPQQDEFVRQGRPAELTMTTWTRDGASRTERLRLTDRPGPQTFHRVRGGVARLRLTIGASYGEERGRRVALAEIEVFRRP
ncbi:zinc ribbon domain-containing protein [Micromonospora okii]|uniref:zinc ribbon domain-containing protein n=1 Tax=Micromonospora okii TaxID=1182970 RepID=UPI001E2C3281|nr:zinc ribbon domain-containing protein [Micromonospora okii]